VVGRDWEWWGVEGSWGKELENKIMQKITSANRGVFHYGYQLHVIAPIASKIY